MLSKISSQTVIRLLVGFLFLLLGLSITHDISSDTPPSPMKEMTPEPALIKIEEVATEDEMNESLDEIIEILSSKEVESK
jgi:hypothetical protein